jgi:hypothetical protein
MEQAFFGPDGNKQWNLWRWEKQVSGLRELHFKLFMSTAIEGSMGIIIITLTQSPKNRNEISMGKRWIVSSKDDSQQRAILAITAFKQRINGKCPSLTKCLVLKFEGLRDL